MMYQNSDCKEKAKDVFILTKRLINIRVADKFNIKMKLIADSGSTKTEWRIIDTNGNISQNLSDGINPHYQNADTVYKRIKSGVKAYLNKAIKQIYFYGAGCSSAQNNRIIADVFTALFPTAKVHINHDLLAAAHALCGFEKGISCILGTGSNSCLYDGKNILENIPSLGYILGDEGSGNYLGRILLTDFARGEMPQIIKKKLINRFNLTTTEILKNSYQKENSVQYFARFSKFIFQNIKEPYLYQLVYDAFTLFFEKNILKYSDCYNIPVHFVGSVAFYYSNILRKVAVDTKITVKRIAESPIAGLALYHQ